MRPYFARGVGALEIEGQFNPGIGSLLVPHPATYYVYMIFFYESEEGAANMYV